MAGMHHSHIIIIRISMTTVLVVILRVYKVCYNNYGSSIVMDRCTCVERTVLFKIITIVVGNINTSDQECVC